MFWITGAKGLLGSALCAKCKAALHLKNGAPEEASSLGLCIAALHSGSELDISDLGTVRAFVKKHPEITHIFNCAAYSLVDAAESEREKAWRANAIGPENLAIVANEIGAKLIHISTDYVFPGNVKRPQMESDPVGPCNYYGETKLEGERRALQRDALVIRTSWIFGDGGKNFVAKLFHMLQMPQEIKLTDDQWGRPTYAPDLAEALLKMKDAKGLYQYANRGVATKYEFAIAMREEMQRLGFPIAALSIAAVPGKSFVSVCKRPVYSAFDTTKIERLVSIRHWQEALKEFLCEKQPVSL